MLVVPMNLYSTNTHWTSRYRLDLVDMIASERRNAKTFADTRSSA